MKRLIMIVVVAILALGIGAGGGYFAGIYLAPPQDKPKPKSQKPADDGTPDADLFYDLPELLVALHDDADAQSMTLKLGVSVECVSADDLGKLQEYLPRVLDAFQVYVRTIELKDLRGVKNLQRFREALRTRIETAIKPGKIKTVLFRDMTVE
jgi:flagellar FliL protein